MNSHIPQLLLAGYLAGLTTGVPVVRYVQMKRGGKGFIPWRDFWAKWAGDLFFRLVLVTVLFWGGFWS